jgi:hypothetical protein
MKFNKLLIAGFSLIILSLLFIGYVLDSKSKGTLGGIGPMCNKNNCSGEAGTVKGINNGGMKFNNSFNIRIDNSSLDSIIGGDDFKIDLWTKTSQDTIGDLLSKGYGNSTWIGIAQRNSQCDYQIWVQFDNGKSPPIDIRSKTSFNDNKWHHLVVDFNKTNDDWNVNYYVDDKLEATKKLTNFGLFNSTGPLMFGTGCADKSVANKNGCFEYWGSLDEIKIYNQEQLIFYNGFNSKE